MTEKQEKQELEKSIADEAMDALRQRLNTIGLSKRDEMYLNAWINSLGVTAWCLINQGDNPLKMKDAVAATLTEFGRMTEKP